MWTVVILCFDFDFLNVAKCNLGKVKPTPMRSAGGGSVNPMTSCVVIIKICTLCEAKFSPLFVQGCNLIFTFR